eukprot:scaffold72362_cov22-Tisochrysis_lutea.AAC.2
MVIDARGLQSKRQTFLECSELPPWRMQGHPQLSTECRTLLLMRTGCFAEDLGGGIQSAVREASWIFFLHIEQVAQPCNTKYWMRSKGIVTAIGWHWAS